MIANSTILTRAAPNYVGEIGTSLTWEYQTM